MKLVPHSALVVIATSLVLFGGFARRAFAEETPAAPAVPAAAAPRQRPRMPEPADPKLPSLILIGDSTMRNGADDGQGKGPEGQWGWGHTIADLFDPTKINVVNRAVGGLSSRTYLTLGHWERALAFVKPGDFVIVQLGTNDGGAINDNFRARASIKGTGEETQEIDNLLTKKHEVVHTYGWYLRQFIRDSKAKGATPIVCSILPRKTWDQDGRINRNRDYAGWAAEVAAQEKVGFIDLNEMIAAKYDALGRDAVMKLFPQVTPDEHTHTNLPGAILNAQGVIAGLKALKPNPLGRFFSAKAAEPINVYLIGGQSNATGQGYLRNLPAGVKSHERVLLFHSGRPHLDSGANPLTWIPLRGASESPDRFGPELGFGNRMQAGAPDRTIALIKHAHSGTSLYEQWSPGDSATDRTAWGPEFSTFVDTVEAGLRSLREQGFAPTVRGMLWQQGEADALNADAARDYGKNLAHFIARVREQFGAPDLVFVYGYVLPPGNEAIGRDDVRRGQWEVNYDSGRALTVRNARVVYTDDLSHRANDPGTLYPNDHLHFGTQGTFELGVRMAEAMQSSATSSQRPTFYMAAPTPPMGWNSWDCFATTVTEAQTKAQADVMADKLARHGWNIVTVDIQWYEPEAKSFDYRKGAKLVMDNYGRLLPAPNRFPSAVDGAGFKPLADYVHAKGLRFGLHLLRGIPRQAVEQNTPIRDTKLHAADIADREHVCQWNTDMFGVDMSKPGAQEYYDSIFVLFAKWGVDFVKVDDLSRPYGQNLPEIEAIRRAIEGTGGRMALSLSPGETPIDRAPHVLAHANMWRISDDFWDKWPALLDQFERLRKWAPFAGPGHWPDADMLPLGTLDMGRRQTHFTPAEQRTMLTLWSIARSPLILGADLTKLDDATLALLTNDEVIAVDQHSRNGRQLLARDGFVAWIADVPDSPDKYVAVFNTNDKPKAEAADFEAGGASISISLAELGFDGTCQVRDLWRRENIGEFTGDLTPGVVCHGAALFRFSPVKK